MTVITKPVNKRVSIHTKGVPTMYFGVHLTRMLGLSTKKYIVFKKVGKVFRFRVVSEKCEGAMTISKKGKRSHVIHCKVLLDAGLTGEKFDVIEGQVWNKLKKI